MATWQEFYCDASGAGGNASNLNGGSDTAAPTTSTNGAYTQGGGAGGGTSDLFAAASGTPFSGRAAGDYVSICDDATTGVTVFIGRVTAVNGGGASIDIDSTKSSGTRPTTAASGKTARVGGPWLGPNAAVGFPFGFITNAATDGSGNAPRVNLKGGTNYAVTAAMTHSTAGPIRFQGYTTAAGDGGKVVIDGGTTGTSYTPLTLSGANLDLWDCIVQNNGATGSAAGFNATGGRIFLRRVVINSVRGNGLVVGSNTGTVVDECEFYACNQSNTASSGGVSSSTTVTLKNSVFHDNAGSNSVGVFSSAATLELTNCIFDTNGAQGLSVTASTSVVVHGCDFYNNVSDGARLGNTAGTLLAVFKNCNFIKNGTGGTGYGINGSGSANRQGLVVNCGFGAGTQANATGATTGLKQMSEQGSVTYAADVTPWNAPATGDFSITLAAAKAAGRGSFTETQASYTGTVAYPDIGAGQASSAGGGGSINKGIQIAGGF